MPIRFRCAYCNQLMAISRRKAGTVVRCPKCAGEIIVPAPEGAPAPPLPDIAPPPVNNAFDNDNFDAYLDEPAGQNLGARAATQAAAPSKLPSSSDLPVPTGSIQRKGVFLPMGLFFVSLGVIVLLLIAMFVVGFLIGRP